MNLIANITGDVRIHSKRKRNEEKPDLLGGWEEKKNEIITGVRSVTGFGGRAKYQSYCGGTVWYMRWTLRCSSFRVISFINTIPFYLNILTGFNWFPRLTDFTDFTNISKCKEVDLEYPSTQGPTRGKIPVCHTHTPGGTNQVLYRYKFLDTKQKKIFITTSYSLWEEPDAGQTW